MSKGKTLSEFIEHPLLYELDRMVNGSSPAAYLSFGQVAMGIEFLGACCDSHPWRVEGESAARFRLGLTTYMAQVDNRYGNLNTGKNVDYDLYSYLRCGMAHLVRPQGFFGLVGKGTADADGHVHLEQDQASKKVVLVDVPFFDDFKTACHILLGDLPKLEANDKANAKTGKFDGVFLPIS